MTDVYTEFFEKYLLGKLGVTQRDYLTEDFINNSDTGTIVFINSFNSFLIMSACIETEIRNNARKLEYDVVNDIMRLEHYFNSVLQNASAPALTEEQIKDFTKCISGFLPEYFVILQNLRHALRYQKIYDANRKKMSSNKKPVLEPILMLIVPLVILFVLCYFFPEYGCCKR